MPCPLPDQQPLPAHVPRSEGTPDRGQGVACEWLEAVEVERSLSRIGGELLAASESPAVRVRHGFVRGAWGPLPNPYPLGTAATLQGGWQLKVNSALINADSEVEAVIDPNSGLPLPIQRRQRALSTRSSMCR